MFLKKLKKKNRSLFFVHRCTIFSYFSKDNHRFWDILLVPKLLLLYLSPFPPDFFFVLAFIFCIGCSGCLETVFLGLHACVWAQSQNSIWLFATLWTVARQAPLSVGSSRQEYWSGLPCPPPEDLSDPGIKAKSLTSPALAGGFFTTRASLNQYKFITSLLSCSGG